MYFILFLSVALNVYLIFKRNNFNIMVKDHILNMKHENQYKYILNKNNNVKLYVDKTNGLYSLLNYEIFRQEITRYPSKEKELNNLLDLKLDNDIDSSLNIDLFLYKSYIGQKKNKQMLDAVIIYYIELVFNYNDIELLSEWKNIVLTHPSYKDLVNKVYKNDSKKARELISEYIDLLLSQYKD